ncbi:hypothetical protein DH2020_037635 [Rehmannia glutinosa]|uniref:Uncharacterized protein n=1 Tax=Rehmannia glutinosa TaxID=99300 RepID=A0ABR0V3C5_REHGL
MLQRQIMFKQLQELQRKQQLQELGNNRNQNYVHQLSSVKQASGGQLSPETSVQDSSRMFVVGNMQMMQHGGPNGLFYSQNHNHALSPMGPSHPQFDENLNQYSHLQGPSNLSVNLLTKNHNSSLGMATMHPPAFGSSFVSETCDFSSDQISMPDGLLLSNQEKNFFGQVPFGGFNSGILSDNYPQNAASLDPLEQKILYNTDDNSWESAFSKSRKPSSGGFENTVEHTSDVGNMSSIQSGSWSALMQSAVAETSSSDVQEEWSGLSFQNPEPLNESEKLQNNWVDRNLQNPSSPSSKPDNLFQNINMNCGFTNYQQSAQYLNQKEEYHAESSHATMQPSPINTWPGEHKEQSNNDAHQPSNFSCTNEDGTYNNLSGHEFKGTFWLQGSTLDHVSGIQKKYDQVNQLNIHGYSVNPENMAPGKDVEAMPTLVGASLDCHAESMTAPSESMFELLNKDDEEDQTSAMHLSSVASFTKPCNTSPLSPDFGFRLGPANPQAPQSYSFFPSLSMGSSTAKSPSSHIASDYIKNQRPAPQVPSQMPTDFPAYSAVGSRDNSELKITHTSGSEFPISENVQESQPPSSTPDMLQNYSLRHQMLSTRSAESDGGVKNFPLKYDHVSNQHSIANARELFLSGQHAGVKDRSKSDPYAVSRLGARNLQQMDIFRRNDTANRSIGGNDGSNLTYQSQISLQMAPSWFKHYETLKNGQMLPMYDTRAAVNVARMNLGNLQESSSIMKVNLANAGQGSDICPSTVATSMACKQLNPPCVLPSDVTHQKLVVSIPKKRKLAALDLVPWHKEVNHEQSRIQDISTSEYLWAEASNRRPEEVNNEAEVVEELLPVNRAKRRLISTTQLLQQVFRSAPAVILCSDASANCVYVAYFAARLALGDAWSLTGQLASDINSMSPDKLKTSKRTNACEFSKIVEAFINRVKKVEADLSRVGKTLSFVDIKVEAQELEKFSIINRFAKFHIRAHPITVNPASSSGTTTVHRTNPQRYVVPHPMPSIVPEGYRSVLWGIEKLHDMRSMQVFAGWFSDQEISKSKEKGLLPRVQSQDPAAINNHHQTKNICPLSESQPKYNISIW